MKTQVKSLKPGDNLGKRTIMKKRFHPIELLMMLPAVVGLIGSIINN